MLTGSISCYLVKTLSHSNPTLRRWKQLTSWSIWRYQGTKEQQHHSDIAKKGWGIVRAPKANWIDKGQKISARNLEEVMDQWVHYKTLSNNTCRKRLNSVKANKVQEKCCIGSLVKPILEPIRPEAACPCRDQGQSRRIGYRWDMQNQQSYQSGSQDHLYQKLVIKWTNQTILNMIMIIKRCSRRFTKKWKQNQRAAKVNSTTQPTSSTSWTKRTWTSTLYHPLQTRRRRIQSHEFEPSTKTFGKDLLKRRWKMKMKNCKKPYRVWYSAKRYCVASTWQIWWWT